MTHPLPHAYVQSLHVYPVKSMGGQTHESIETCLTGFQDDRQWMVTTTTHKYLSIRELPRLATLNAKVQGDNLILSRPSGERFVLPRMDAVHVISVTIFDDVVQAVDVGDNCAAWLSEYLHEDVRLVRKTKLDDRVSEYTGHAQIAFSDDHPVQLISEASIRDLNDRLKQRCGEGAITVSHERFRPNIVIAGSILHPYKEDEWHMVDIGEVTFRCVAKSSRCVLPNVDPKTGVKGDEPYKTLQYYRRVDPERKYKAMFGIGLAHKTVGKRISVGDIVEGRGRYDKMMECKRSMGIIAVAVVVAVVVIVLSRTVLNP